MKIFMELLEELYVFLASIFVNLGLNLPAWETIEEYLPKFDEETTEEV